jgi:BASS family bile acid:Na+ symporter
LSASIATIKGTLIKWSFFLIVYTVVGLNQEMFLSQPMSLLPAALITLVTTFLLGTIIDKVGKSRRINNKRLISMVLLGTSKNAGFGAGLALSLFNRRTALPTTIQTIAMITYVIYLDYKKFKYKMILDGTKGLDKGVLYDVWHIIQSKK